MLINGKCFLPACKGKVNANVGEKLLYDTFRYLQSLFDVEKHKRERPKIDANGKQVNMELPHEEEFKVLKTIVDQVLDESKYNKVDLNSIFSLIAAI